MFHQILYGLTYWAELLLLPSDNGRLGQTCSGLCSWWPEVLASESDGADLMARMTCMKVH